ncbi:hypothetical protein GE061_000034 [Apolygus lucorum]|uniref:Uncharacterized protein n=1 Tax=Apolygus lucorum TaxID=248454 RepID=A0A8S9Y3G4_APOLU|nr:hypothetical protein GE061_000034 [Apolygus lucorum]
MATFRPLLKKKKASLRTGTGTEDVFQPIWFAFDVMESFLGKIYDVEETINTEDQASSLTRIHVHRNPLFVLSSPSPLRDRNHAALLTSFTIFPVEIFNLKLPYRHHLTTTVIHIFKHIVCAEYFAVCSPNIFRPSRDLSIPYRFRYERSILRLDQDLTAAEEFLAVQTLPYRHSEHPVLPAPIHLKYQKV